MSTGQEAFSPRGSGPDQGFSTTALLQSGLKILALQRGSTETDNLPQKLERGEQVEKSSIFKYCDTDGLQ